MKRTMDVDFNANGNEQVWFESYSMDQYSAHLDRGWELVARGDFSGARASVESIHRLEENSPDGHTLNGAVCLGEGDYEAALEALNKALEHDPDHIDAMVYLAEVLSQDQDSREEALGYVEKVRDLLIDDLPVETAVLEAEILWNLDNREESLKIAGAIEKNSDISAVAAFRLGRLYFEAGFDGEAKTWLEWSLTEGEFSDAYHYLGILEENSGRTDLSLGHFLRVRELDLQAPVPPWSFSSDLFEIQIESALESLGIETKQKMSIVAVDYPSPEIILEGADPRIPVYLSTRGGD